MKYLFTNKEVKVGDVCIALCIKDHLNSLNISKFFPQIYEQWKNVGKIGFKIVWTSKNRSRGYMVYEAKKGYVKPYLSNGEYVYSNINVSNNIGLIKYEF